MESVLRELFVNFLSNAEILLWAWGICQTELAKDWRNWLTACVLWVSGRVVVLSGFFDDAPAFFIGLLCDMLIMVIFLMRGRILDRTIKYWFSLFYLGVVFQPIRLFMELLASCGEFLWMRSMEREIEDVLTVCIVLLIAGQIRKHRQWVERIRSIPVRYYIVGLFCVFCAEAIHFYIVDEIAQLNTKGRIFWGILLNVLYLSIYVLGVGLAFANLLKEQYSRESRLKSEYLRMAQEHYDELATHMREIRSIRHDMQAHIAVMENLIRKEKWQEAGSYLAEIKGNMEWQEGRFINVGNELVNAVLENELRKADAETAVIVEGWIPERVSISDFDLCVIFSNLLSNAVEACSRLKTKDRRIRLEVRNVRGKLLVQVENPVEERIPLGQLGKYTSKGKHSHGYGIYNIRKAVEKYGGEVDFQIVDGIFSARISFFQEI